MSVVRFGVSIEEDLMKELDEFVKANSFPNRSQAVRFLIEKNVTERKWQCNNRVAGAVMLMYDVNRTEIAERIIKLQFDYKQYIASGQRFFPENEICIEIIVMKGIAGALTSVSDKFISIKGIKHGKLIMGRTD